MEIIAKIAFKLSARHQSEIAKITFKLSTVVGENYRNRSRLFTIHAIIPRQFY